MVLKVKTKSENDVILQRQIQTSCNYNSLVEYGYFLLDHNVFMHARCTVAQSVGVFLNFTGENNDETRQDVKEKLAILETTFCVHLLRPFNLFSSV